MLVGSEGAADKLAAIDQGERALQEGSAIIACLKEACEGKGEFHMPMMATMLTVVLERLSLVDQAIRILSDAS